MRIRWTGPAVEDLEQISGYTRERFGPAQARKTTVAIYECVQSLRRFPRRGRVGRLRGTREITVKGLPYAVVYTVADSWIEVMRVLYAGQNWP
jgi:addiction module RelE/StbE family toxin